jgi:phospholipid/cholesterol/gamma-HCH transport system permease protein
METIFAFIGSPFVKFIKSMERFGVFIIFQLGLIPLAFKRPWRIKQISEQIVIVGIGTLGVVSLVAIFTGLVQAIQLYQGFSKFGAEGFMGYTIFYATVRELSPIFAGLMLISRSISSMAAELGTMRVTEQIDAIETLAVDSKKYLIIPRIVGTTISLPLLVLWFDAITNIFSFFMAWLILDMNPVVYQDTIHSMAKFSDIGIGVIKGLVYGYLVGTIGSFIGYHTSGGAKGVGISTTRAVVISAVTIFIANFFLSQIFILLDW